MPGDSLWHVQCRVSCAMLAINRYYMFACTKQEVWTALALAAVRPGLATLTRACQVALSLYLRLGARVLLQLEAFLAKLLLPLAAGKASPSSGGVARQEAALEVLPR